MPALCSLAVAFHCLLSSPEHYRSPYPEHLAKNKLRDSVCALLQLINELNQKPLFLIGKIIIAGEPAEPFPCLSIIRIHAQTFSIYPSKAKRCFSISLPSSHEIPFARLGVVARDIPAALTHEHLAKLELGCLAALHGGHAVPFD